MSLIKIEFLAYFRQKRLLSLHAKKAPHSRISLDIQFCQSSVWHCALQRTLTSVLINNVQSDAYCLCYEILFEKSKGKKDNHKSKFFEWDLQRRKSAAPWWKGNLSIVGERKKMFKLPEKTSNYQSLNDERKIVLQLYEAERDIKLSTDRREILNRMHNAVIVKGVKDHVVTPYRLPKLVHTK